MGHITQRQTALVLVTIIFASLLVIFVLSWWSEKSLAAQQLQYLAYLLMTAVLWLLLWFDWRFAPHLTVAFITFITAFSIPESTFTTGVSQGVLLPPILAMVITGIPGVIGSAAVTWIILLWRSGGEGLYTSPTALVIYVLAVAGLVLGRLVISTRLAHERDLLQALMDHIPDLIYFKDTDSHFIHINHAEARYLGITHPDEATGKSDADFLPGELSSQFFTEEQEMMKTGEPILDRVEYNPALDGRDRWYSASKVPLYDKHSHIIGLVGISREITERMLVETALQKSEQSYREIFNATNDAIILYDTQTGAVTDVNDRMLEMFGYTYDEALQLTVNELSASEPPYSAADALVVVEKAITEGMQLVEWRVPRKNGELFWVEVSLRSSQIGGHGRVLATLRDISQRKRAEEALRLSEERFSKAFRSSPDAISLSSLADGRFIEINNAHTRMFGYSQEELIGRTSMTLNMFANPVDRTHIYNVLQEQGELHNLEITWRRRSGELFEGLVSAEIITVQGEKCIVGTVRDITPQKQAAAALQAYARELERSNQELDNFAHVASHDLQEPLRKIQTFSQRLLDRYEDKLDERGQDYLQRMDSAASRMQILINDLLAYARIGTSGSNFSAVPLSEVIEQVMVDLETRLEATGGQVMVSELPTIEADRTQMRQLFQNLISNGLKFHHANVPPIVHIEGRIHIDLDHATSLYLTVTDNGIGFDEKYLPNLFMMFQRLHGRDDYEGTGVGLAICRRIVEQHHGTITAQSQPGNGATFIITLPLTQPSPPSSAADTHDNHGDSGEHTAGG